MLIKRVGFWLSQKKSKKLNFDSFQAACKNVGIHLIQIDLNEDLELQGPFDLIIHKLTDIIAKADQNDTASIVLCQMFEAYSSKHPETIILDPFQNVRLLLNRYKQYQIISKALIHFLEVDTPPFVILQSQSCKENLKKLKNAHIQFPFLCKPVEAHGSSQAHEMALVFNANGLERDIKSPCVAQSFINHNATLYKIFVIGREHFVVERPSLKNFTAGDNDTIFFKSNDVSRADACSTLTELDEPIQDDVSNAAHEVDPLLVQKLVKRFRTVLNLSLFGIDMIRDNKTCKYHIIDINSFPGYDGVPDFFNVLLRHLTAVVDLKYATPPQKGIQSRKQPTFTAPPFPFKQQAAQNRAICSSAHAYKTHQLDYVRTASSSSCNNILPPCQSSKTATNSHHKIMPAPRYSSLEHVNFGAQLVPPASHITIEDCRESMFIHRGNHRLSGGIHSKKVISLA